MTEWERNRQIDELQERVKKLERNAKLQLGSGMVLPTVYPEKVRRIRKRPRRVWGRSPW